MFGFPRIEQNLQYYFRWRQDGESVNSDVGTLSSDSYSINEEMQRVHEVRTQNLESVGYEFITII